MYSFRQNNEVFEPFRNLDDGVQKGIVINDAHRSVLVAALEDELLHRKVVAASFSPLDTSVQAVAARLDYKNLQFVFSQLMGN